MSEQETALADIQRTIQSGDFATALDSLRHILDKDPGNAEALYMRAVCQRYLKLPERALEDLEALKRLVPGHGRAHQEEGHLYRSLGRLDEALRAYGRACYYNPALEASLRAQIEILDSRGNKTRSDQLRTELAQLQATPRPLVAVIDLIAQNKLLQAEALCRKFLQKNPSHVRAMRLLADIGIRLGVLEDAEFLLESAVEFEPENIEARIDYIQALRKRQKFFAALGEAEKLLEKAPDNPRFKSIFAVECMQTGKFDQAISHFKAILDTLPNDPVTLTSLGHAYKTQGDAQASIATYKAAIKAHPFHGEAYYSLANLKTYKFSQQEIATMQSLGKNSNLSHMDLVYIHFALGKAFEDSRDYQQSFDNYQLGNALKKAQSRYRADIITAEFEQQQKICTAELLARGKTAGCQAGDPIFIVGLPRAGSTLLEQILASHSMVDGTLELPNILSLSQRLRRRERQGDSRPYPALLADLSDSELRELGEEYIEDTRVHRQAAPFFIDKMPNNFRHIGLIKMILPNAKIIDARRNPMACCFSGFKQLFAEGQEFSYSLEDIGHYYRDYVSLMQHWDGVLPGEILTVENEVLIDDFDNQLGRMLDYCGLPFEEQCLRYYETERDIRTPSAEQVRKPLSRAGIDQWRNYEPWLAPLVDALGPLAELSSSEVLAQSASHESKALQESL
ncbi:MAG: sulfotransferase [Pseudomonadales bacterium]|nr:sulfotransferase [Pseudomonadales bacterium]